MRGMKLQLLSLTLVVRQCLCADPTWEVKTTGTGIPCTIANTVKPFACWADSTPATSTATLIAKGTNVVLKPIKVRSVAAGSETVDGLAMDVEAIGKDDQGVFSVLGDPKITKVDFATINFALKKTTVDEECKFQVFGVPLTGSDDVERTFYWRADLKATSKADTTVARSSATTDDATFERAIDLQGSATAAKYRFILAAKTKICNLVPKAVGNPTVSFKVTSKATYVATKANAAATTWLGKVTTTATNCDQAATWKTLETTAAVSAAIGGTPSELSTSCLLTLRRKLDLPVTSALQPVGGLSQIKLSTGEGEALFIVAQPKIKPWMVSSIGLENVPEDFGRNFKFCFGFGKITGDAARLGSCSSDFPIRTKDKAIIPQVTSYSAPPVAADLSVGVIDLKAIKDKIVFADRDRRPTISLVSFARPKYDAKRDAFVADTTKWEASYFIVTQTGAQCPDKAGLAADVGIYIKDLKDKDCSVVIGGYLTSQQTIFDGAYVPLQGKLLTDADSIGLVAGFSVALPTKLAKTVPFYVSSVQFSANSDIVEPSLDVFNVTVTSSEFPLEPSKLNKLNVKFGKRREDPITNTVTYAADASTSYLLTPEGAIFLERPSRPVVPNLKGSVSNIVIGFRSPQITGKDKTTPEWTEFKYSLLKRAECRAETRALCEPYMTRAGLTECVTRARLDPCMDEATIRATTSQTTVQSGANNLLVVTLPTELPGKIENVEFILQALKVGDYGKADCRTGIKLYTGDDDAVPTTSAIAATVSDSSPDVTFNITGAVVGKKLKVVPGNANCPISAFPRLEYRLKLSKLSSVLPGAPKFSVQTAGTCEGFVSASKTCENTTLRDTDLCLSKLRKANCKGTITATYPVSAPSGFSFKTMTLPTFTLPDVVSTAVAYSVAALKATKLSTVSIVLDKEVCAGAKSGAKFSLKKVGPTGLIPIGEVKFVEPGTYTLAYAKASNEPEQLVIVPDVDCKTTVTAYTSTLTLSSGQLDLEVLAAAPFALTTAVVPADYTSSITVNKVEGCAIAEGGTSLEYPTVATKYKNYNGCKVTLEETARWNKVNPFGVAAADKTILVVKVPAGIAEFPRKLTSIQLGVGLSGSDECGVDPRLVLVADAVAARSKLETGVVFKGSYTKDGIFKASSPLTIPQAGGFLQIAFACPMDGSVPFVQLSYEAESQFPAPTAIDQGDSSAVIRTLDVTRLNSSCEDRCGELRRPLGPKAFSDCLSKTCQYAVRVNLVGASTITWPENTILAITLDKDQDGLEILKGITGLENYETSLSSATVFTDTKVDACVTYDVLQAKIIDADGSTIALGKIATPLSTKVPGIVQPDQLVALETDYNAIVLRGKTSAPADCTNAVGTYSLSLSLVMKPPVVYGISSPTAVCVANACTNQKFTEVAALQGCLSSIGTPTCKVQVTKTRFLAGSLTTTTGLDVVIDESGPFPAESISAFKPVTLPPSCGPFTQGKLAASVAPDLVAITSITGLQKTAVNKLVVPYQAAVPNAAPTTSNPACKSLKGVVSVTTITKQFPTGAVQYTVEKVGTTVCTLTGNECQAAALTSETALLKCLGLVGDTCKAKITKNFTLTGADYRTTTVPRGLASVPSFSVTKTDPVSGGIDFTKLVGVRIRKAFINDCGAIQFKSVKALEAEKDEKVDGVATAKAVGEAGNKLLIFDLNLGATSGETTTILASPATPVALCTMDKPDIEVLLEATSVEISSITKESYSIKGTAQCTDTCAKAVYNTYASSQVCIVKIKGTKGCDFSVQKKIEFPKIKVGIFPGETKSVTPVFTLYPSSWVGQNLALQSVAINQKYKAECGDITYVRDGKVQFAVLKAAELTNLQANDPINFQSTEPLPEDRKITIAAKAANAVDACVFTDTAGTIVLSSATTISEDVNFGNRDDRKPTFTIKTTNCKAVDAVPDCATFPASGGTALNPVTLELLQKCLPLIRQDKCTIEIKAVYTDTRGLLPVAFNAINPAATISFTSPNITNVPFTLQSAASFTAEGDTVGPGTCADTTAVVLSTALTVPVAPNGAISPNAKYVGYTKTVCNPQARYKGTVTLTTGTVQWVVTTTTTKKASETTSPIGVVTIPGRDSWNKRTEWVKTFKVIANTNCGPVSPVDGKCPSLDNLDTEGKVTDCLTFINKDFCKVKMEITVKSKAALKSLAYIPASISISSKSAEKKLTKVAFDNGPTNKAGCADKKSSANISVYLDSPSPPAEPTEAGASATETAKGELKVEPNTAVASNQGVRISLKADPTCFAESGIVTATFISTTDIENVPQTLTKISYSVEATKCNAVGDKCQGDKLSDFQVCVVGKKKKDCTVDYGVSVQTVVHTLPAKPKLGDVSVIASQRPALPTGKLWNLVSVTTSRKPEADCAAKLTTAASTPQSIAGTLSKTTGIFTPTAATLFPAGDIAVSFESDSCTFAAGADPITTTLVLNTGALPNEPSPSGLESTYSAVYQYPDTCTFTDETCKTAISDTTKFKSCGDKISAKCVGKVKYVLTSAENVKVTIKDTTSVPLLFISKEVLTKAAGDAFKQISLVDFSVTDCTAVTAPKYLPNVKQALDVEGGTAFPTTGLTVDTTTMENITIFLTGCPAGKAKTNVFPTITFEKEGRWGYTAENAKDKWTEAFAVAATAECALPNPAPAMPGNIAQLISYLYLLVKPGCKVDITRTLTIPATDKYDAAADKAFTIILNKAANDDVEFSKPLFLDSNWAIIDRPCGDSMNVVNGDTTVAAVLPQNITATSNTFVLANCPTFAKVELKILGLINDKKYDPPPKQILTRVPVAGTTTCVDKAENLSALKLCTPLPVSQFFTILVKISDAKVKPAGENPGAAVATKIFTLDFDEPSVTTTTTTTTTKSVAARLRRLDDAAVVVPTEEPVVTIESVTLVGLKCDGNVGLDEIERLVVEDGFLKYPPVPISTRAPVRVLAPVTNAAGAVISPVPAITDSSRTALRDTVYVIKSHCTEVSANYTVSVAEGAKVDNNNGPLPTTPAPTTKGSFQKMYPIFYVITAILTSFLL